MLAALYMLTRRLWAAIGLHAAWNFAQGGIYGVAVSGFEVGGLLRPRMTGPDLLTGGSFVNGALTGYTLKPLNVSAETSTNWDLGYRYHGENFSASGSLFFIDYSDRSCPMTNENRDLRGK